MPILSSGSGYANKTVGITGLRGSLVGMTGLKNPIGDPLSRLIPDVDGQTALLCLLGDLERFSYKFRIYPSQSQQTQIT